MVSFIEFWNLFEGINMPVNPNASVRISAFNWVPPFAQGHVHDLRSGWALEEAGISYSVRKSDATTARPAD